MKYKTLPLSLLDTQRTLNIATEIITRYTELHRAYHTLIHPLKMFQAAEKAEADLTDAQILAIWFHDIVYDPRSKNNELASADLMHKLFEYETVWPFPSEKRRTLATAHKIILATAHHAIDQKVNKETGLVLDLDLAGLADPYEDYLLSTKQIRHEFKLLSAGDFIEGRMTFLTALLQRSDIYYTQYFRTKTEYALLNVHNELKTLKALC
jgi:predicted metal-dependent HD superfamily phosphohydrolase